MEASVWMVGSAMSSGLANREGMFESVNLRLAELGVLGGGSNVFAL